MRGQVIIDFYLTIFVQTNHPNVPTIVFIFHRSGKIVKHRYISVCISLSVSVELDMELFLEHMVQLDVQQWRIHGWNPCGYGPVGNGPVGKRPSRVHRGFVQR